MPARRLSQAERENRMKADIGGSRGPMLYKEAQADRHAPKHCTLAEAGGEKKQVSAWEKGRQRDRHGSL